MTQQIGKIGIGLLGVIFLFYLLCIDFRDSYHVVLCRNELKGEVYLDTLKGIKITPPWVRTSKIDTRPVKLCIDCNCANINCKLIQFDYNYYQDFTKREKFCYFWWKNRLSFNISQENEYRGMKFILRSYAFDEVKYKFIKEQ